MEKNNGFNMVLTGVGGQGIVLLSNAIGNACVEAEKNAITGELHGLSQRSGSIYIHMRIGDDVQSPLIPYGTADAIVSLEAMEALRYIEYLKNDGVILMNKRIIHPPIEIAQLSREKRKDFIEYETIIEKLKSVTSGKYAAIPNILEKNQYKNAIVFPFVLSTTHDEMKERRKHPRTNVHFPVYFICIDNDDNEMMQDIAVVLNISENGILMESSHDLTSANYVKVMAPTKNNYKIEVKGKVVYTIKDSEEKFFIGISFQDSANNIFKFTKNLIGDFHSK